MNLAFRRSAVRVIAGTFACMVVSLAVPTTASAKELASAAIAASVDQGTFDEVRQAILMDMHQQQRFDFDEDGVEAVGRDLMAEGRLVTAVEVLQLNQMIHGESALAANALADAFQESGNPMAARMYYQRALEIDPANEHARGALAKVESGDGGTPSGALANAGIDPATLAAMGVTPEQMQQLEEAMAQAGKMETGGGAIAVPPKADTARSPSRSPPSAEPAVAHESEYCEVLHRYNAEKKISDAGIRSRFEGEYGQAGDADRRKTWNVETACREFLVAVPLWADVSPPVLIQKSATIFEDATGAIWDFQTGGDGTVTAVIMVSTDGTSSEMKRLGDPRSFD